MWKREKKRQTLVSLHDLVGVPVGDLSAYYVINALALAKHLRKLICEEGIDVVVAANPLPGLLAAYLAERINVPFVTDYLDHFPDSATMYYHNHVARSVVRSCVKLITRISLERSTRIVVVSNSFWKLVVNEYGLPHYRISCIPNGVDLDRFRPRSRDHAIAQLGNLAKIFSDRSFNILYSGTILPRVDLETPFKVVERLREEGLSITFVVTGVALDGSTNRLLQRYQRALFFRFLGNIQEDLLPYVINVADACIAPYRLIPVNYGITLKMLEYLSSGKRLFATPIPDLIERFSGFVSTFRNIEELEIALRQAVLMKDFGGSQTIPSGMEEFSWNTIAERYESLLREITE